MRVERLQSCHVDAYEAFVSGKESALLFQSPRYLALLQDLLDAEAHTMIVLDDGGRIVGALPLLASAGPHGRVFNSLPFYGSNGGILADNETSLNMLVDAYNRLADETGVAALTLVTNPLADVDYSKVRHDLTDERIGQFTPLQFSRLHAEQLMQSFHYKTRNMIRKAEKLNVAVSVENSMLDFVEDVHRENMQEIGGQPKPQRFFELLPAHFRAGQDYRVYVARLDGQAVAAALLFYFNRTVEYFTPVIRKEHRETQALSKVIYDAMCDASADGYNWWNWGGTWKTQEGVYRFKKRWGTLDRPYYYLTRLVDDALARLSSTELLEAYPSFYVMPFSSLVSEIDEA